MLILGVAAQRVVGAQWSVGGSMHCGGWLGSGSSVKCMAQLGVVAQFTLMTLLRCGGSAEIWGLNMRCGGSEAKVWWQNSLGVVTLRYQGVVDL